jgi:hypothetical protein
MLRFRKTINIRAKRSLQKMIGAGCRFLVLLRERNKNKKHKKNSEREKKAYMAVVAVFIVLSACASNEKPCECVNVF